MTPEIQDVAVTRKKISTGCGRFRSFKDSEGSGGDRDRNHLTRGLFVAGKSGAINRMSRKDVWSLSVECGTRDRMTAPGGSDRTSFGMPTLPPTVMVDFNVKRFIDKMSLTQTMRQVEASMARSRIALRPR